MLLSYKIAACSSESSDHPVRELQSVHSQSRGWQSTRWCEFPQELVLQFPATVTLQQVQVLSHQFKIASRVELFMGTMPPGVPAPTTGVAGVKWARLGHFSLDSNERSGYQARELKTVYVPRATEGKYLKLVLHKCHVNEHNLYNQIGLLAVRAIGTGPGAAGAPPVDPLTTQVAAALMEPPQAHEPRGAAMDPSVIAMVRELEEQKKGAIAVEDYEEAKRLKVRIDQLKAVGVQLAELERKKTAAVAGEDYDAAKGIKDQLNELRIANGLPQPSPQPAASPAAARAGRGGFKGGGLGGPTDELKDNMALERAAAQARIEQLAKRAGTLPPPQPKMPPVHDYDNLPPGPYKNGQVAVTEPAGLAQGLRRDAAGMGPAGMGPADGQLQNGAPCYSSLPPSAPTQEPSLRAPQPQGNSPQPQGSPLARGSFDRGGATVEAFGGAPTGTSPRTREEGELGGGYGGDYGGGGGDDGGDDDGGNFGGDDGGGFGGGYAHELGIRHLHAPDEALAPSSDPFSRRGALARSPLASRASPGFEPPSASKSAGSSALRAPARATNQREHEERQVSRAVEVAPELPQGSISSDLPPPEALSPSDAKDAAPLIDVFGEHLVRCLYSKVWNLRQAAITGMMELVGAGSLQVDGRTMVHVCCKAVGRCCTDKMVQVYLAGLGMFTVLFDQPAVHTLPRADWLNLLSNLTPHMFSKLGDGNARVREASEAALLATCRLQQLGPGHVTSVLTAPLDPRKQSDFRLQLGRLQLLGAMLGEFGDGMRANARELMGSVLKAALESSRDTVRNKAIEVAQQLYAVVGDLKLMSSYLGDLNPATRDHLIAALEQTSISKAGAASRPPTIPPSPPSQRVASGGGGAGAPGVRSGGGRGGGGGGGGILPAQRAGVARNEISAELPAVGDLPVEDDSMCQFCGLHNPTFTEEKLDLHFWKECPMLMPCEQCGQIVEIAGLNDHITHECDMSQTFRYQPPLGNDGYHGCPLCALPLSDDPADVRHHFKVECQGNLRRQLR